MSIRGTMTSRTFFTPNSWMLRMSFASLVLDETLAPRGRRAPGKRKNGRSHLAGQVRERRARRPGERAPRAAGTGDTPAGADTRKRGRTGPGFIDATPNPAIVTAITDSDDRDERRAARTASPLRSPMPRWMTDRDGGKHDRLEPEERKHEMEPPAVHEARDRSSRASRRGKTLSSCRRETIPNAAKPPEMRNCTANRSPRSTIMADIAAILVSPLRARRRAPRQAKRRFTSRSERLPRRNRASAASIRAVAPATSSWR